MYTDSTAINNTLLDISGKLDGLTVRTDALGVLLTGLLITGAVAVLIGLIIIFTTAQRS